MIFYKIVKINLIEFNKFLKNNEFNLSWNEKVNKNIKSKTHKTNYFKNSSIN